MTDNIIKNTNRRIKTAGFNKIYIKPFAHDGYVSLRLHVEAFINAKIRKHTYRLLQGKYIHIHAFRSCRKIARRTNKSNVVLKWKMENGKSKG